MDVLVFGKRKYELSVDDDRKKISSNAIPACIAYHADKYSDRDNINQQKYTSHLDFAAPERITPRLPPNQIVQFPPPDNLLAEKYQSGIPQYGQSSSPPRTLKHRSTHQ